MNTMNKLAIRAALLMLAGTGAAATGDAGPARAPAAGKKDASEKAHKIELLRRKMGYHRYCALAWARMADFDEAIRELREADELFQIIKLLAEEEAKKPQPPDAWAWNFDNEVALMRLRAEAHGVMVKQFSLPAGTLGFIKVVRYQGTQKLLWSVIYTLPPEKLTKADVLADPTHYYIYHIPGSRSYIATYTAEGPVSQISATTFKKVAEVEVPYGFTPTYVQSNNGGFLLVQTTSYVPGAAAPPGAMLLCEGKPLMLSSGPCAGPVIVPRKGENRIDALITGPLFTVIWAVQKTDKGLVMAEHHGTLFHWDQTITFEGDHIVEITFKENDRWKKLFIASEPKPITMNQAKLLGRFYGMRTELERALVTTGSRYWSDPKIEFDKDKRQWLLNYSWGRIEIAGGRAAIVLDEHGKLVNISQFIVPR